MPLAGGYCVGMQKWINIKEVVVGDKVLGAKFKGAPTDNKTLFFNNKEGYVVNRVRDKGGSVWLDSGPIQGNFLSNHLYQEILVDRPEPKRETAQDVWSRLKAPDYVPPEKVCPSKPCPATRQVTTADDMAGAECFRRYCENMREGAKHELTKAQKTLAQLMWSVELKQKQAEQRKQDASTAISVVIEWDENE